MPLSQEETIALARESGWRPKEEFRGDPEKWVEADVWVTRGENFFPIIKADRDRARAEAQELRAKTKELSDLLTASQEAIQALKEHQSETTKRHVKAAESALKTRLREAREAGNLDEELAIQDELTDLRAAREAAPAPAPKPAPAPPAPAAPTEDPATAAWVGANPWFTSNARKRGYAMGVADEIRNDPATKGLVGKAFFEELDRRLADDPVINPPAPNKFADGKPAGSPSTSGASGRKLGYADLPADAKAACDSQAKLLVGPGRAFKNADEWRANYAATYFSME